MIRILYEDAWTLLFVGLISAIVAAVILNQMSGRAALLGFLAGLLLTGLLVGIERYVVTERERIIDVLGAANEAFKKNDTKRLLELVAPGGAQLRTNIQGYADNLTIHDSRIADPRVAVNELTSPPSASAVFSAWADFTPGRKLDREWGGVLFRQQQPFKRVEVGLVRLGDQWLLQSCEVSMK